MTDNEIINRQEAEIERLKELVRGWKKEAYKLADEKDELYCNAVDRVKTAKTEAVKEFAERLKKTSYSVFLANLICVVNVENINNLVKEMVGDG